MNYTAFMLTAAMTLLLTACGSNGVSEDAPIHSMNAEACIMGEARDTVLYIRNLDDFEWVDVTVDLIKSGMAYQAKFNSISPDTETPTEAITNPRLFSLDNSPGVTGLNPIGDKVSWRAVLGNFANLESAKISIKTPFSSEWAGQVDSCQQS